MIHANNTYPAQFIYDNLAIAATRSIKPTGTTSRSSFLGARASIRKFAPQPMPEDCLLTGVLEPTNEPYVSPRSLIKLCESYRRQYGCIYLGYADKPLRAGGHLTREQPRLTGVAAQGARGGSSRKVSAPGLGQRRQREFLHVDDLSSACLFLMDHYDGLETVNVGTGVDLSIRELAETIVEVVGGGLTLEFDAPKPDGTPRKLLDVSRLADLWLALVDRSTRD